MKTHFKEKKQETGSTYCTSTLINITKMNALQKTAPDLSRECRVDRVDAKLINTRHHKM